MCHIQRLRLMIYATIIARYYYKFGFISISTLSQQQANYNSNLVSSYWQKLH